jgi:hypothetical protein
MHMSKTYFFLITFPLRCLLDSFLDAFLVSRSESLVLFADEEDEVEVLVPPLRVEGAGVAFCSVWMLGYKLFC